MKEDSYLPLLLEVMTRGYAPYSKFAVGAVVRSISGALYTGANVENAAYPQGWCAETSALAAMIMAGETRLAEIAVMACRSRLSALPVVAVARKFASLPNPDTRVSSAMAQKVCARPTPLVNCCPTRLARITCCERLPGSRETYS